MFPMRNLRRMHPICTGSFIDGFASFERFERYTGFKLCAVLFSLCRHLSSPHLHLLLTQHSILITCPVFGVHYSSLCFLNELLVSRCLRDLDVTCIGCTLNSYCCGAWT